MSPYQVPALALALATAAFMARDPATAQTNILGPCRDGYRWMATTTSGAPVAAYATCTDSRPLVIVACGATWPELRVAAAPGTRIPAPGEPATGTLTVDGQPQTLRLAPGPADGSGVRVIRAQLGAEAIRAMAAGLVATLDLAGTRVEMHLGASGDVLNLFTRQC